MNKLQLTKGELTKIILEEVRSLQEQDLSQIADEEAAKKVMAQINQNPSLAPKVLAILEEMEG
tara:strand:+ start:1042 stop:1230 length:189 start_codon:yes stop_codon:yes gene_type:complete